MGKLYQHFGHIQIEKSDAESIVSALRAFLTHNKCIVANQVGIGNDNASIMAGINNGVYTELKKDVPLLILIKCACPSLPLTISYTASECSPSTFLSSESHSWPSNSSIRRQKYCGMHKAINDN